MMSGHEKSDSVIGTVKPANKAAHPAVEQSAVGLATAELGGAKDGDQGSADKSTCRAQSRVSACHRRKYGSVRGADSNGGPYRNRREFMASGKGALVLLCGPFWLLMTDLWPLVGGLPVLFRRSWATIDGKAPTSRTTCWPARACFASAKCRRRDSRPRPASERRDIPRRKRSWQRCIRRLLTPRVPRNCRMDSRNNSSASSRMRRWTRRNHGSRASWPHGERPSPR
jgi:hypothetical protein